MNRVRFLSVLVIVLSWSATATASSGLDYRKIIVTGDPAPGAEPGVVVSAFTGPYTHPGRAPDRFRGTGSFFAFPDRTGRDDGQRLRDLDADLLRRADPRGAGRPAGGWGPRRRRVPGVHPGHRALRAGVRRCGLEFRRDADRLRGGQRQRLRRLGQGVHDLQLLARAGARPPALPRAFSSPIPCSSPTASKPTERSCSGASAARREHGQQRGPLDRPHRPADPAPARGQPGARDAAELVFGSGQFLGSAYTFRLVQVNHDGRMAVGGTLLGPGIDTFSNEAIFAERGGQLTRVMREAIPRRERAAAPRSAAAASTSRTTPSPTTASARSPSTSCWEEPARADVALLGPPGIAGARRHARRPRARNEPELRAARHPHPERRRPHRLPRRPVRLRPVASFGVWWDQTGTLTALVVPGQQVPAACGLAFAGINFIHGCNAAGQIAFSGDIADPVSGTFPVLVLAASSGAMKIVAQQDQPFDVSGDGTDLRVVSHHGGRPQRERRARLPPRLHEQHQRDLHRLRGPGTRIVRRPAGRQERRRSG